MTKKVLKVYFGLDLIVIFLSLFFGIKWLLNSQVAFICALIVIYFAYKSYKKRINLELLSGKYDNLGEFEDDNEAKKGRFSFTFFAPFKMLSYAFMALCIYALAKFDLFWIVGFLAGVSIIPIGTLVFAFLQGKKENSPDLTD